MSVHFNKKSFIAVIAVVFYLAGMPSLMAQNSKKLKDNIEFEEGLIEGVVAGGKLGALVTMHENKVRPHIYSIKIDFEYERKKTIKDLRY